MSLQLVLGRAHSGKTQYILDTAKELYDKGESFVIVVPEQFTHLAEKRLIEKIGCIESGKAEVLSFDRIARRINSLYPSSRQVLDSMGKALIISDILSDIELKYYKSASTLSGFVNICNEEISELKSYMVTPDMLRDASEKTDDTALSLKLGDIYCIYNAYEESLKDKFSDADDKLSILTDNLEKYCPYRGVTFFFDEFSSFNPRERAIISVLSNQAKMLYVSFCADTAPCYASLFKPTLESAAMVKKACKDSGCRCEKDILLTNSFYENREMCILEKYLYTTPIRQENEHGTNIRISVCENPYTEVESVARKILAIVKEEGVRYRDIGIVCSDISSYSHIVQSVFDLYRIPYFIDEKVRILDHSIISFVIGILDVYLGGYSRESVVGFLKSGCIKAQKEDIYTADNFIIATNATKNTWLSDERWERAKELFTQGDEAKSHSLDNIRNNWILPLARLHDTIKGRNTVRYVTEKLYNYLLDIDFDEVISDYIKLFKSENKSFLAKQYERVWNTLIEAFDALVYILGDKQVNLSQYRKYLYTAFDQQKTGIIPTTLDEIIVGDVKRSKSGACGYQFVLGAIDGAFPSVTPSGAIVTDEEKKKLSSLGIELTPGTEQLAYFDRFLIYSVLTHPQKSVFVSYPASDSSFSAVRPAFVISILQKMFPNLKIEGGISKGSEIVYTDNFALEHLISAGSKIKAGKDGGELWKDIYTYFKESGKQDKIDYARRLLNDDENVDVLDKNICEHIYRDEFYSTVSRIQKYNACRYSYYLEYMLSLHEKKTYEMDSTDVGTLIHEIIEKAFKSLAKDKIDIKDATNEYFQNHVCRCLDEYISGLLDASGEVTQRELFFVKNLQSSVLQSLNVLKQHLAASKFVPLGHEITFDDSSIGCIELKLEDGKKVKITGKIDRADYFENENGTYYRIIDYKTGSKTFSFTDVFYGLDVQLLVYMNALVEKNKGSHGAGALYFRIQDPIKSYDEHMTDEKHRLDINSSFKMDGVISSEPNVVAAFSEGSYSTRNKLSAVQMNMLCDYVNSIVKSSATHMLKGHIDINPCIKSSGQGPCLYCKFGAICNQRGAADSGLRKLENVSSVKDAFEKISKSADIGEVQQG